MPRREARREIAWKRVNVMARGPGRRRRVIVEEDGGRGLEGISGASVEGWSLAPEWGLVASALRSVASRGGSCGFVSGPSVYGRARSEGGGAWLDWCTLR